MVYSSVKTVLFGKMCSCTIPSTRSEVTSGVAKAFTLPMPRFAAAFHDSDHWRFPFITTHRTAGMTLASSSVIHLIHLHRRSLQLHVSFGQQRANLAEHPPSSLVGHSGFTLNLFCRDSTTSRGH